MTKISIKDLVERHYNDNDGEYNKKELTNIVKEFTSIMNTLVLMSTEHEDEVGVTVPDLGTFSVKTRNARQGRNPRNAQEIIEIPESKALTFKQSTNMKKLLND